MLPEPAFLRAPPAATPTGESTVHASYAALLRVAHRPRIRCLIRPVIPSGGPTAEIRAAGPAVGCVSMSPRTRKSKHDASSTRKTWTCSRERPRKGRKAAKPSALLQRLRQAERLHGIVVDKTSNGAIA